MDLDSLNTSDQFKAQLKIDNPQISEQEIQDSMLIFNYAENFIYPDSNLEANLIQFKTAIENQPKLLVTKTNKPQFHMFKWLSAAVVLLMISFGVWQYLKPNSGFIQQYVSAENVMDITLEDGSFVKLNKFSKLEVLALDDNERRLKLSDGEAFFNVKHNRTSFIVETGKGDIVVKGTQFNVKNRKGLPLSIALKEGLVHFENNNEFVELLPGESLIVDNQTITKESNENKLAWLNGELKFSNQTLAEIIKELSATYQVVFKYEESLSNEKLTITFQNLSAQQAAELLSKTINSKVEVE